jgi:hypothetical protein
VWALLVVRLAEAAPAAGVAPGSIALGVIAAVLVGIVGARVLRADPPRVEPLRSIASAAAPLVAPKIAPSEPEPVEPQVTIEPVAVPAAKTTPARARPTPHAVATASASDLQAELRALGEARAALVAGRADDALALLRKHARQFAGGALSIDREVLRIDALCASGRDEAARGAVERFVRAHGASPQAAHVKASCGGA